MKMLKSVLVTSTLTLLAITGLGHAQTTAPFPSKTVTLVVPFNPASGSDIIARLIVPKLSARWGQPVIIDNKPGASGNIGAAQVATAAPDGHTLLMAISVITMTPALYKNMPYDTAADFAPVAKLAEAGYALAVHPSVPAKDMASLLELIKKSGGKMNFASSGSGTPQHVAMEMLKLKYGLDILHVPYKGIQGALTDLAGGQVQMMIASVHSLRPLVEAGKVREIATTGTVRNPLAPNVPTFKEQGIDALDSVDAWYAVMAPAKTPADVVARINKDFIDVINQDDIKSALAKQGLTITTGTPAQLGTLIKSDLARWQKIITDAKIKAD